jgi:hypothetical protein
MVRRSPDKVAEQADLGAVVDDFLVDVEHEAGRRRGRELRR